MGNADHLDQAPGRVRAKLVKGRSSRPNGYAEISGSGAKANRYGEEWTEQIARVLRARGTQPRRLPTVVAQGSPEHARRYHFAYLANFRYGFAPYPNEGHHLIPGEAFSERFFEEKHLELIRQIDYDIDNGKNILFLPVFAKDTAFHSLPYHHGSHPRYTAALVRDMQDVRQTLERATSRDEKHEAWTPPSDLRDQLLALQEEYWGLLTAVFRSPTAVNAARIPASK